MRVDEVGWETLTWETEMNSILVKKAMIKGILDPTKQGEN